MSVVNGSAPTYLEGMTVAQAHARAPRLTRLDTLKMASTSPPPVPWLVEPLVVRGALTLLAGREGIGKSLLAMAVAVGVATAARQVGPFEVAPGRVLLVDAENGPGELHRRIRSLGLDPEAAARVATYVTEAGDVLNQLDELAGVMDAERPDLVVLDSFRSLWSGKENDSDATGPALDAVRNLARRSDAGVLLLHHASRAGDYRGSTAIGAAAEIVVGMSRADDDPQPDRFVLRWSKMRPAARPAPAWVRLDVEMGTLVSLEVAEAFDTGEPQAPQAPAREALAPRIRTVLEQAPGPLPRAEIARQVGRDPKDRTVGRVLDRFAEMGHAERSEGGWRWRVAGGSPLSAAATLPPPLAGLPEPHGLADLEGWQGGCHPSSTGGASE